MTENMMEVLDKIREFEKVLNEAYKILKVNSLEELNTKIESIKKENADLVTKYRSYGM